MKLSEAIVEMQKLLDEHGDLTVFTEDTKEVGWLFHRVAEKNEFPKEWKMPEGYEYITIEG